MGSPVSPMLANFVLEDLEETVLGNGKYTTPFYFRYVDDVITALNEDDINTFLEDINSYHRNLKFTKEIENNGKIAFLDTLLIREVNGSISTNWYHKPTWSGRYLNFESWLPISYKRNTISLLSEKILNLSDKKFHDENFKLLTKTLLENNYPKKMIKEIIFKTKSKKNFKSTISKEPAEKRYGSIPYVKDLFEKIKPMFKQYNIQLVGRANKPLEKQIFSKLKDKTEKEKQSNIIYNIKCDCKKNYVGQTTQYLLTRFKQHERDGNPEKTLSNKSALSQHLCKTGHNIDFKDVSILAQESNLIKRNILEMVKIKKTHNTINLQNDTSYLPNAYDNLLFKKQRGSQGLSVSS